MCTDIFATITIHYTDKAGADVAVTDFSVKNMRTGLAVKANGSFDPGASSGIKAVANDGNLKSFHQMATICRLRLPTL